jgi:hypothetical protein
MLAARSAWSPVSGLRSETKIKHRGPRNSVPAKPAIILIETPGEILEGMHKGLHRHGIWHRGADPLRKLLGGGLSFRSRRSSRQRRAIWPGIMENPIRP